MIGIGAQPRQCAGDLECAQTLSFTDIIRVIHFPHQAVSMPAFVNLISAVSPRPNLEFGGDWHLATIGRRPAVGDGIPAAHDGLTIQWLRPATGDCLGALWTRRGSAHLVWHRRKWRWLRLPRCGVVHCSEKRKSEKHK